jgi:fluoroquinolone transport system permease protein
MPDSYATKAFVLIIFSDISLLGMFFIGAIVFLERDQGIMQTLFVTPLSVSEYIISQVLALTGLSLLMGLLIGLLRFGFSLSLVPLVAAITGASVLSTLFGIALAVKQRRVTSYFVICTMITLPFFLPVLHYLNIIDISYLQLFLPTAAILNLLGGTFSPFTAKDWLYASLALIPWGIFIGWLTVYRFDRYIIRKIGEV